MSLRVIWQYMDRSVTKKILYGSFSPYNIFWVTDRSIYCHMTLSAMNYLLYRLMNERIDIENLSTGMVSTEPKESKKLLIFFHSDHVFSLQFRSTRDTRWLPCQI